MNTPEFEINTTVDYWNGKNFIKTKVINLFIDPVNSTINYVLSYKINSRKYSIMKLTTTPDRIKQSQYFSGQIYE